MWVDFVPDSDQNSKETENDYDFTNWNRNHLKLRLVLTIKIHILKYKYFVFHGFFFFFLLHITLTHLLGPDLSQCMHKEILPNSLLVLYSRLTGTKFSFILNFLFLVVKDIKSKNGSQSHKYIRGNKKIRKPHRLKKVCRTFKKQVYRYERS